MVLWDTVLNLWIMQGGVGNAMTLQEKLTTQLNARLPP